MLLTLAGCGYDADDDDDPPSVAEPDLPAVELLGSSLAFVIGSAWNLWLRFSNGYSHVQPGSKKLSARTCLGAAVDNHRGTLVAAESERSEPG
jgi:hypothetical protein